MADIVISGDSSGSITLRAPAVSGTTILTMPTTSGTLVTTAGGSTVPFALGSAAAPSITFTGDTNTGIFSPGADTIAFSEGGVESMRISSVGFVGIGTNNPLARLEVSGNQSITGAQPTFAGAIRITDNPTVVNATGGLEFFTSSFASGYGWKMASIDSSGVQLTFATRQNSATWSEQMRITSDGDVLIGTTAQPTNNFGELTVQTGSSTKPAIQWSGGDTNWWGRLSTSTAGGSIGTFNSIGGMWSISGSTFTCRRDLAGFPSAAFYVSNQNSSTFNPYFQWLYNTGGSGLTDGTTTVPMTLDSSGNLLVNLTSTSGYSSVTTPKTIINAGNNGGSNTILCGAALVNQANGGNSGYGVSIRFNNSAGEPGKYSAIAGVADSSFSNSTGLAFFTTPNAVNGVDNVTQRMYINGGGSIGAPSGTNIYNASDARLKKNIADLTSGLDTINALRPVTFNWQENFCKEENDKILYGFIAQETQAVDENLVEGFGVGQAYYGDSENPTVVEDPLRVNEKFIIPILVKAIQELNAKVTALEAQLGAK
jgi:hypothetical protein